ncbi:hypothetical protein I4F81_008638 [Pyropia yezoensis]|uniref:Uncharacterized protein n=1 Tax=Pyropia yezoensis TaxID=2788 RepID=A0ACC3C8N2_PYRYE|nr:hypothetical protein I4F81_008638 [Neopyropia yezoensis]
MHLLPTKQQLRHERRVALDSPTRAHHFFWTKTASGDLCRWDYVLGSATAGVRRYRLCDGTVKRLQCHTNRYWDARRGGRDEDDASDDEDNGIFYDNENVEYEGCYSPLETDPVKAEELMAMSRSFLENEDGTGATLILAVAFDVASILQRAINEGVKPGLSASEVGPVVRAVLTFAADGGTIKRKEVTAYTATISYEHSEYGRTDLAAIAYVFSGEKRVDKAIHAEIRSTVGSLTRTNFTVPVIPADGPGSSEHDRRTVVPVLMDPEIQVCADFSMMQWVHALTGRSDEWRCAQRSACKLAEYLHPWAHLVRRENRSSAVVGGQWELAILMMACWAACSEDAGSPVGFKNGEALYPCPECDHLVPYAAHENGSAVLCCRSSVCLGAGQPFPTLQGIPKSTFDMACNAARRVAGGVRGYPLFFGMNTRLQLPVLHCTGNLLKMVILFTLACLPAEVSAVARRNILAITSKGKVESLYLREFRETVAGAVACPAVLSADLDPVFFIILQLVQVINAGWRSSLTDKRGTERAASAATTRLAASMLGPLFHQVKPLDPDTKDAKVVSLYLHAPIAHLHHQVGNHRAPVAYVSDDNMEGNIRGAGRFVSNNGSNAPQAALFSDLVGLKAATINFSTSRSHPSSLLYTKFIRVCKCWATLGKDGPADYAALRSIAEDETEVNILNEGAARFLSVQLPLHERADDSGARKRDANGQPLIGKKEAVRRGLRRAQHTIVAAPL